MRDPTRQSMRSTRRAPREDATNAHEFPRVRTHTHERIHPSRASFARLHPRVASHRVASTTVARVTAAIQPPPGRPRASSPDHRRRPGRREYKKNTSSPHSARAPRTVPLARPVAVVDTVVVVVIVPIIIVLVLVARAESSRRRVTSRRHARDRWVYWFFFWIFVD